MMAIGRSWINLHVESRRNLSVAAMARWSEDSALPFGPPNARFGFAAPQRRR
jgi:hypothetical protein